MMRGPLPISALRNFIVNRESMHAGGWSPASEGGQSSTSPRNMERAGASSSTGAIPKTRAPPNDGCLGCNGPHALFRCPSFLIKNLT